jgi:seryl-tRNA synthetase
LRRITYTPGLRKPTPDRTGKVAELIPLDLLHTEPDLIRDTVRQRGVDADVDRLIEVYDELREAITRSTTARSALRRHAMGPDRGDAAATQALRDEVAAVNEQVRVLQETRDELWGRVPNLLAPDTPAGGNVELRREGDPGAIDETRRYDTVGAALGILTPGADSAPGSGPRWRGDGARLAWAVFTHAQWVLHGRGYTPLLLPSGQALIGYHGDQIIDVAQLPIRLCGFCSTHQVEQVVLCRAEDAAPRLDECQRNAEDLLRDLELPYRVLRVGARELDAAAYQAYATETWFPGSGAYLPTHTSAHSADYLARRFKIRYLERGRVSQPDTLSATALTDHAVLAILENHRQPDGSVRIPEPLRPYLGGQELIEPALPAG